MSELERKTSDISSEERSALMAQFEASGLEYPDFAREHNINRNTLRNWISLKKNPGGTINRFTAVERKKMVEAYLASGLGVFDFCKAWGVSGASLRKWVQRYEEFGADGLVNLTPKATDKRLGSKIPRSVQDEIVRIKKQEPSYGLKRIRNWMFRFRGVKVSTGSIRKTVKSEGLVAIRPRKKRRSLEKVRRFERARPMQLWQSDITQFTLGPNSMRVYLTVFMDDHSRYIVGFRLQSRQTAELVIDAFKDACVRFGKPEEVLTDQGRQYFAWRGKSELEKLLEKEGIKHVVSRAHHPQTLGKCERFWETIQNEFWTRVKPQDLEEARVRLKYFIDHYNHQRPHQGLDGSVPADRFFGVAEEVRSIIEKTVLENSLKLSLGELPKAPAFLIGQVGDQRIAFHGSGGGFYLTNENLQGDEDGESIFGEKSVSVRQYAIERAEKKQDSESDNIQCDAGVSGDSGAGALVEGDTPGASPGAINSADVTGGMERNEDPFTGCAGATDAACSILADEQSGDGGVTGGMFNPATSP